MSRALITPAWEAETGPTEKLVLVYLADRANDNGRAWPSLATIMRATGLSESPVRRSLRKLERAGYLETTHQVGTSSTYRVKLGEREPARAGTTPVPRTGVTTLTPRSHRPGSPVAQTGGSGPTDRGVRSHRPPIPHGSVSDPSLILRAGDTRGSGNGSGAPNGQTLKQHIAAAAAAKRVTHS